MKGFIGALILPAAVACLIAGARAEDKQDAQAVLDKAIKALGGEEKLSAVKAFTWKSKGTVYHMGEHEITVEATAQGLNHFRRDVDVESGGAKLRGITVLNGDRGWQKFGEMGGPLDAGRLANEKRIAYLQIAAVTVMPLKGKRFKVVAGAEEKVNDKPAVGLKVTGPDGKEFQIYFDKETGFPVKEVGKVLGLDGEETTQETTFGDFKPFDGLKFPTKILVKRDGENFMEQEITDYKVLDKVDPKKFEEPK